MCRKYFGVAANSGSISTGSILAANLAETKKKLISIRTQMDSCPRLKTGISFYGSRTASCVILLTSTGVDGCFRPRRRAEPTPTAGWIGNSRLSALRLFLYSGVSFARRPTSAIQRRLMPPWRGRATHGRSSITKWLIVPMSPAMI